MTTNNITQIHFNCHIQHLIFRGSTTPIFHCEYKSAQTKSVPHYDRSISSIINNLYKKAKETQRSKLTFKITIKYESPFPGKPKELFIHIGGNSYASDNLTEATDLAAFEKVTRIQNLYDHIYDATKENHRQINLR